MRSVIGFGRLSLHTAGPDNPDRATRPQLLGTEAIGSGPGWHGRSGAGQSGMEWVEGGDFSGISARKGHGGLSTAITEEILFIQSGHGQARAARNYIHLQDPARLFDTFRAFGL